MTSASPSNNTSIDGLQYLRGIAALMVVFFHSRSYFSDVPSWTGLGARGVDVFFVISGFIMAYSTQHLGTDLAAVKASLLFLAKRIIRVVPLYWIAVLWTSAPYWINWLTTSHSLGDFYANFSPELISFLKDLAFIPHLSIEEDEQGEIFPIVIQGWTLNYEMFFYFIFGLSLLLRKHRLLAVSVVIVALVVLGKIHKFKDVAGLFYTSSILIEFVFGIMLFHVYTKTHQLSFDRVMLVVLGVVGFLLLNSGSNVNDKFVLAVAATIIVWVFIHAFRGVDIGLLKLLGDASYSIYLFHPAAFLLARWFFGYAGIGRDGYLNVIVIVMGQVLVALVIGITIYYMIEKPMLKILRNLLGRVAESAAVKQT